MAPTRPSATRAALAAAILVASPLAAGQTAPLPTLPELTVSATRLAEETRDVPATITVIDSKEIDRNLVQSLRDLFRYEPGVSVNNDPNRFGGTNINIRGLEGNRVAIQVDGVRAPSLFTFGIGPFNTSTRSMIDLDSLKKVEVLRGPASTLYGSDALGGVVSYLTKDPLDVLDLARSPFYASAKSLYADANDAWQNTATLAAGTKEVQGLLIYTYLTHGETKNFGTDTSIGPARTAPNPLEVDASNMLAKIAFTPDAYRTLKFTYERYWRDAGVDVLSLNASTPTTSSITGQDENRRDRGSIDWSWRNPEGGWFAGFTASLYQQRSATDSASQEIRTNTSATCSGTMAGTNLCSIPRDFEFRQTLTGGSAQLESLVAAAGLSHRILWGAELYETESSALRDALRYNLTTGTVSNVIAGDTFPVRDFPNTKTTQLGLYVQDQIAMLDDRLVVTPALRFDYYRLRVHPDDIYNTNAPTGVAPSNFSDNAWSPKLSAVYAINPNLNVYANYAFGFRAPPFDDVNATFRNPVQMYALVPNPNLKSETSQGIEAGMKADGKWGRVALAGYYNRYHDFIDSRVALDCPADPSCVPGFLFTFQSVNRASVRIWGLEAKGEYVVGAGWTLAGSVAYANGRDTSLGEPLNSIAPLTGVASVRYDSVPGRWGEFGGALNVTAVDGKSSIAPVGSTTPFATPGFATVDLTGYWNVNRQLRFAAGVFNLFDKKYWLWSDVSSGAVASDSAWIDRYTQPGLNASVSLQLTF